MEANVAWPMQLAFYLVAAAILAFVAVGIPLLFRLQRQIERAAAGIEQVRVEVGPLVRETRELVDELRAVTGKAQRLVDEVGSVVEPPLLASSTGIRLIKTGVTAFMRSLWRGSRYQSEKTRWV